MKCCECSCLENKRRCSIICIYGVWDRGSGIVTILLLVRSRMWHRRMVKINCWHLWRMQRTCLRRHHAWTPSTTKLLSSKPNSEAWMWSELCSSQYCQWIGKRKYLRCASGAPKTDPRVINEHSNMVQSSTHSRMITRKVCSRSIWKHVDSITLYCIINGDEDSWPYEEVSQIIIRGIRTCRWHWSTEGKNSGVFQVLESWRWEVCHGLKG